MIKFKLLEMGKTISNRTNDQFVTESQSIFNLIK